MGVVFKNACFIIVGENCCWDQLKQGFACTLSFHISTKSSIEQYVCMYTFLTLLLLFASTRLAWTVHAVTAIGVYQNVDKISFALMYQVPLAALYFMSYNTERIQLKSKYGDTAANTHCYSRLFLSWYQNTVKISDLKKLTFNVCFWLLDVCRFCCCSFCIVLFLFLCKLILTNPGGCGSCDLCIEYSVILGERQWLFNHLLSFSFC